MVQPESRVRNKPSSSFGKSGFARGFRLSANYTTRPSSITTLFAGPYPPRGLQLIAVRTIPIKATLLVAQEIRGNHRGPSVPRKLRTEENIRGTSRMFAAPAHERQLLETRRYRATVFPSASGDRAARTARSRPTESRLLGRVRNLPDDYRFVNAMGPRLRSARRVLRRVYTLLRNGRTRYDLRLFAAVCGCPGWTEKNHANIVSRSSRCHFKCHRSSADTFR